MNTINTLDIKEVYDMKTINGMTTVNGGTIMQGRNGLIEVLGPGYSIHPGKSIYTYTMDNSVKVGANYWGGDKVVIFRFRNKNELGHYWSRTFSIHDTKTRYRKIISDIVDEYNFIFGKH